MQTGTIHISIDEGRVWPETWYFATDLLIIYIFPAFREMQALEEGEKSSWMSWGWVKKQSVFRLSLRLDQKRR